MSEYLNKEQLEKRHAEREARWKERDEKDKKVDKIIHWGFVTLWVSLALCFFFLIPYAAHLDRKKVEEWENSCFPTAQSEYKGFSLSIRETVWEGEMRVSASNGGIEYYSFLSGRDDLRRTLIDLCKEIENDGRAKQAAQLKEHRKFFGLDE